FAFLASLVVQTHVAYAPEGAAIGVVVMAFRRQRRERQPISRQIWLATAGVLLICWTLPLYEALTTNPGNLQRLIAFFTPKHMAEHSWRVAIGTAFEQMSVMPLALARTLRIAVSSVPGPVAAPLAFAQLAAVAAVLIAAVRQR